MFPKGFSPFCLLTPFDQFFAALSEETLFSYYLQVCRTGILLPEMNLSASSIPNSVAKDLADLQPYLLPAIAERGLDQGRTLTLVLKYFLADCAVKGFDSSEQVGSVIEHRPKRVLNS